MALPDILFGYPNLPLNIGNSHTSDIMKESFLKVQGKPNLEPGILLPVTNASAFVRDSKEQ